MLESRHDTSLAWVAALQGPPGIRDEAVDDLYRLLLRGARFELTRSPDALSRLQAGRIEELATAAADDALAAVLANLDAFRGASRFSTWASKFVLRIARRRLHAATGTTHG